MSKSLANPFGVLCDDAVEELSYNKKLAKQIVRAERVVVKSDAPAAEKKAKKDEPAKDKKAPKAAAPAAEDKPAAAPAAAAPAAEEKKAEAKPAAAPIKITRSKVVDSVPADQAAPKEPRVRLTIQRAGEAAPLRAGKREHDRHESGTGRGKEQRKGGAGKANWGSDKDPKDNVVAAAAEGEKKPEGEAAAAAAPAAEKKAEDAPASRAEEKAPEEKSLTEFFKSRAKLAKKAPKFEAKPVSEVAEEAAAAATPLAPAAANVAAAPAAAEEKKPAAAEKKAEDKPAEKKQAKVQLKLVFYDEAQKRAERSRPMRDDPADDARPRRDRVPRERPAKVEAPAAPAEAPKPEEFPKLC